ncbi:Transcription factor jumonji/aspartyl beta-hydroxylase [Cordyceps fumosorosea ARSEF 2679]|uniref:Transcription factor jumonji/aspartyl beta-hydroxylase n=1 Tax=Cordyceps fumosorosea (strain ARSEF 2679) TaxID=1081104 RepID=A0A162JHX3_CORFA|nr:Transcription factor jumonji/aspartyl beta-hydroxylase [Cordyceps fumosorosea ARSEF 2679]OAA42293.1 Transcription factor jumonji/aspartyl beta-hydroxylase [Cordyceps fumosorosea ARSEF 2679]
MALLNIRAMLKQLRDSFDSFESRPLSHSESETLRDIEQKLRQISHLFTNLGDSQTCHATGGQTVETAVISEAAIDAQLTPSVSPAPLRLSQTSAIEGVRPSRACSPPRAPVNEKDQVYSPCTTIPVIPCSVAEWKDFPRVLKRACALGAKNIGACKATLDVSGLWRERQRDAVRCIGYGTEQQASGVYKIVMKETRQKLLWSEGPMADVGSIMEEQMSRLNNDDGLSGVFYRTDVQVKTATQRKAIGLADESLLWPLRGNMLEETAHAIDGIHTPYFYQSGPAPGAVFAMHVEDAKLCSVNILYKGRKIWIVIPPRSRERLEQRLREDNPDARCCSQFVRHLSVFVPLYKLKAWDVDFSIVDQRAGEAVITFEDTYHEGFSVGSSAAEAINYAAKDWNTEKYTFCSRGCPGPWIDASFLTVPVPAARESASGGPCQVISEHNRAPRPRRQPVLSDSASTRVQDTPGHLPCSDKHPCLYTGIDRVYQQALEDVVAIQQQQKARILQLIMQSSPNFENPVVEQRPSETQKVIARIVHSRRRISGCYLSLRHDYMKLASIYVREVSRIKDGKRIQMDRQRRLANQGVRSGKGRGKEPKTLALELMLGNPPHMSKSDLERCIKWGDCLTKLCAKLGRQCLGTFPTAVCVELTANFSTGLSHFPELARPITPEE